MTRNLGVPLPDPSGSTGHRQKIEAIEYTISTTMPGAIGLKSLKEFAEKILASIEFLRYSNVKCKNKRHVISRLEEAKIPLQLAIDETRPGGSNKRRYQNISLVGNKLKDALNYW